MTPSSESRICSWSLPDSRANRRSSGPVYTDAMSRLSDYSGIAYNPATASENRIHSDEIARQYGFRGGLVPGVTIYACMVEPAVRAWGLPWLSRGEASVLLRKPVYEGGAFRVCVEEGESIRCSVLDPDGVLCAEGSVSLPDEPQPPPVRRGDPPAPEKDARPDATRSALEQLRGDGMGALHWVWRGEGEGARYRADLADMPDLVRPDRAGWAHPGFTLGLANWVLSANVSLGPWIHVESRVRHHAPLALGSAVVVEGRVRDLFEKRGHEFIDLDVEIYDEADAPLLSCFHRAIYRLRPAVS